MGSWTRPRQAPEIMVSGAGLCKTESVGGVSVGVGYGLL